MDPAEERAQLELALRVAGLSVAPLVLPESRAVAVQGLRLHYLDWAGPAARPVVFLHGGGLNAHTWDLVCAVLASEFRCLALDQRGHGDSDWSTQGDYAFETQARDLAEFVDRLGLARVALVGMSMGGINALLYAAAHPERVAALALIDVGPDVQAAGGRRIAAFVRQSVEADSIEALLAQAQAFNPQRDPRLLRRSLLHAFRRRTDGKWVRKNDTRPQAHTGAGAADLQRYWPLVPRIACPALAVRGARSNVLHDADAQKLARALPRGRWARVENAGHSVQGDNPAGLLEVLRPFLQESLPA